MADAATAAASVINSILANVQPVINQWNVTGQKIHDMLTVRELRFHFFERSRAHDSLPVIRAEFVRGINARITRPLVVEWVFASIDALWSLLHTDTIIAHADNSGLPRRYEKCYFFETHRQYLGKIPVLWTNLWSRSWSSTRRWLMHLFPDAHLSTPENGLTVIKIAPPTSSLPSVTEDDLKLAQATIGGATAAVRAVERITRRELRSVSGDQGRTPQKRGREHYMPEPESTPSPAKKVKTPPAPRARRVRHPKSRKPKSKKPIYSEEINEGINI